MDDLDRWTRVMPLGTGAFGEVHLAWDQVDGRWVALKRFTGQDELGLLRMVIESRIRVSHPHLVRTLAFRLVDDRAWLVTELARGGSLRALSAGAGALPWGWVAEAVDQVLAALAALHATGVVHRDLKPANLLLRSCGNEPPHVLVGDFGIATWRTVSMTGIGAAIGTPGYLAPEYLDGHQPSPATDLFAVGVLAAELLTGRRLVHHSNASPAIPSSWHDVLPVPPEVPRGLAAVLQRMADPDPARRYVDSTQAREALLSALPPASRGDLTTVAVPDLLAAVPPSWTPDGPEQPASPTAPPEAPNLTGLPIDGGITALVLENEATVESGRPSAPSPPTPPGGSPSSPRTGSATSPPAPPTGAPGGSSTPPAAERRVRRRRKVTRAFLIVVLVVLAAGGGTLWWAATHRTVAGQPFAVGESPAEPERAGRWNPELVTPCKKVEAGQVRANGTERCQRTPRADAPYHWVEKPPDGFPTSNPKGPFPGEQCPNEGDNEYSPVGDPLTCDGETWRVGT